NGCFTRVLKFRPSGLVVRLDRRLVLSERKFDSDIRVHMAVWKVVHNLPDRPATRPIGRVKLLLRKTGDGIAQAIGRGCDLRDCIGALSGRKRRLRLVLPDWIT